MRIEIQPKLTEAFSDRNYSAFDSIGIIPIILTDELFAGSRERVLRQLKQRSADVRLRIPYEEFCNTSYERRRQIYIDHLIRSVLALRNRMENHAELNELNDIAEIINSIR